MSSSAVATACPHLVAPQQDYGAGFRIDGVQHATVDASIYEARGDPAAQRQTTTNDRRGSGAARTHATQAVEISTRVMCATTTLYKIVWV